jgi:hypothetical protein
MDPRLRRKGLSAVLSTIILAAAILTITVAALFVSTTALDQQLDMSEFEQAKNNVLTLVDIVEHVAVDEGSSGYIRMNLRTAHPTFEQNGARITVTVGGGNVIDGYTGLMKIGGGGLVGIGGGIERLIGSDQLIVGSASDPLGYVYVVQDNGAWIKLDYARVRARYMGKFLYYEGGEKINRSIVRIAFINITFGTIRIFGTGTLDLVARNIRTVVDSFTVDGESVHVTVNVDGRFADFDVGPTVHTPPLATQTVIYIVRMDVEISTL